MLSNDVKAPSAVHLFISCSNTGSPELIIPSFFSDSSGKCSRNRQREAARLLDAHLRRAKRHRLWICDAWRPDSGTSLSFLESIVVSLLIIFFFLNSWNFPPIKGHGGWRQWGNQNWQCHCPVALTSAHTMGLSKRWRCTFFFLNCDARSSEALIQGSLQVWRKWWRQYDRSNTFQ